jgi:hypothetical protein
MQNGESVEHLKEQFVSNFGSIERYFALLRKFPTAPNDLQRERAQAGQNLAQVMQKTEDFAKEQWRLMAAELGDLDHWRTLAAKSRSEYRRELDEVLRGLKAALNSLCGIESHRHRGNTDRDEIIYEIKASKPQLSFGQVAIEYRRRTGKQLTGKVAERSYKRQVALCRVELEDWFDKLFQLEKYLLRLESRLSHNTRKPSVA